LPAPFRLPPPANLRGGTPILDRPPEPDRVNIRLVPEVFEEFLLDLTLTAIAAHNVHLRGFIAGLTITLSKDAGGITWYDLPVSFKFLGWTATEAEKIPARASREAIRWGPEGWRESA
jgi:hypothetical protein